MALCILCPAYDCKNYVNGFCTLIYPDHEYLKLGKKMHVECTSYIETDHELLQRKSKTHRELEYGGNEE